MAILILGCGDDTIVRSDTDSTATTGVQDAAATENLETTATTIPPTTATTTTLPALPAVVHADPFRNMIIDREAEVFYFADLFDDPKYDQHTACITEAAIATLGPTRLAEDQVLADDRLEFDALDPTEQTALAQALTNCDLFHYAGSLFALDHPTDGPCLARAARNSGRIVELTVWTMGDQDPLTSPVLESEIETCQQERLAKYRADLPVDLAETQLDMAQDLADAWTFALQSTGVTFTDFEVDCTAHAIARDMPDAWTRSYLESGATSAIDYANATLDSEATIDALSGMTRAWPDCVSSARVLATVSRTNLTEEQLTCLSQADGIERFFDGTTLDRLLGGVESPEEVSELLLERAESCGNRNSTSGDAASVDLVN